MASESGIPITDDIPRKTPILDNMFEEELSRLFCGNVLRCWDESGILGKTIDNDQDGGKISNFWQSCDVVHRNAFPRSAGDWKWLQEPTLLSVFRLVLLANKARPHKSINIILHLRPIVPTLHQRQRSLHPGVSSPQRVVTLLYDLLPKLAAFGDIKALPFCIKEVVVEPKLFSFALFHQLDQSIRICICLHQLPNLVFEAVRNFAPVQRGCEVKTSQLSLSTQSICDLVRLSRAVLQHEVEFGQ